MERIAFYARVSTRDKHQDPEVQLGPLRAWATGMGQVAVEYVDRAPAGAMRQRTAWQQCLQACARRQVQLLVVWRLDRAFRSVLDAATTLERLRAWRVGFRSFSEPWLDTTTPMGEVLFHITAAYAQLERTILSERVRAGLEMARNRGAQLGRPGKVAELPFARAWPDAERRLRAGTLSVSAAARTLGVSRSTVRRHLARVAENPPAPAG
jgi:DNA invertase Pin-like site-specific DNA recombinase